MEPPSEAPLTEVYRDAHGVPHIVAASERGAWYALGYEQARDGLLWIQYCCRAARGELLWVRGDRPGFENDLAVKTLGAYLGNYTAAQLTVMFAPSNPSIQANFYENCVAFADGVNAYRLLVQQASVAAQTAEGRLHAWLDVNWFPLGQTNLAWVYSTPVTAADIVSQGSWTTAVWSFLRAEVPLVNSYESSYSLAGPIEVPVDPDLVEDPLAPGVVARLSGQIRQHVSHLPGMPSAMCGSNTFAWSRLYCIDPSTTPPTSYAGLLADPHQALPFYGPNFMSQFPGAANHMWFAHVLVTPPGNTQPTLDAFGHVPYASATFQSMHNRDLAVGGTSGGPNFTDHFLLRLEEVPGGGAPVQPRRFYSYYHDSATNPTNATYQSITDESVWIQDVTGPAKQVPYWRAQSFGLILPDLKRAYDFVKGASASPDLPIVYGERVDATPNSTPPHWRINTQTPQPKMRFWSDVQAYTSGPQQGAIATSPMVLTLRAPMDANVAGNPTVPSERLHRHLARDFWEISHATSLQAVAIRTNGAGYPVNVSCVDRNGGVMTTQLGAIPKRGDDALMSADGYTSTDKVTLYGVTDIVPARHAKDRMFDWRFGTTGTPTRPGPLEYLDYPAWNAGLPTLPATNIPPFKPITVQYQATNAAFPPTNYVPGASPFWIESGFFASATNDQIWGYSRKADAASWAAASGQPRPWEDLLVPNNWLLRTALQAGCAYQSVMLALEGPDRHQNIVEQFTRQAEWIVTGGATGLPPQTPAQMRQFVVNPKLHIEPSYRSPSNSSAHAHLPMEVRQIKEAMDNSTVVSGPLERAKNELHFFKDLWAELNNPASPWSNYTVQPGVVVNLRDLWVNANVSNHLGEVFWYDDPNVLTSARWLRLPVQVPLIDFLWSGSDLGTGWTTGQAAAGPVADVMGPKSAALSQAVQTLVTWDSSNPGSFREDPTAEGACLLEMLRMGYAEAPSLGTNYGRHWTWLTQGITAPINLPWAPLSGVAFPLGQGATLMRGGIDPPYDALYLNPSTRQVRSAGQLGAAHINAMVKFFLELGGHYIDPATNEGNPSRKWARWNLANGNPLAFGAFLPASYPLTGGLERCTVLHRLADAKAFLGNGSPPLSTYFRARAYDHNNQKLWPAGATVDTSCVGSGLRSVVWHEDGQASGFARYRGFQPSFLGMAGSYATLLTMFPSHGSVESYFWCTPGVQAMGDDPARFDVHMDAFATNVLMPSHYSNFWTTYVGPIVYHDY